MPFQLQPENDHLVISQKTKELDFPCHETSSKPHLHHDFADENEDEPSNDHAPLLKDAFSSTSTMKDDSTIGSMVAVTQAKTTAQRLRALGYIVFSAFNFSIMSTCIKYASRFMSSTETVFWRCSTAWFMNYALRHVFKVSLHLEEKHRKIMVIRCIIGYLSMWFQFYAISQMILTDAIVIIFTSPVITFILGAWLLKETVDKIDFGCALISYVGVFIVSRPAFLFSESISSPAPNAVSVLCALLGAFFQACAYICMRKLHDVHFVVIIHYFLLTAIALTIFILILTGQTIGLPTNGKIIMSILGGGFFASVGQVFMTLGFQQEKAGIASVMRYFDIIFVLFWDIVILQEEVHLLSILGGLVVLGSAIIIAIRKAKKSN